MLSNSSRYTDRHAATRSRAGATAPGFERGQPPWEFIRLTGEVKGLPELQRAMAQAECSYAAARGAMPPWLIEMFVRDANKQLFTSLSNALKCHLLQHD